MRKDWVLFFIFLLSLNAFGGWVDFGDGEIGKPPEIILLSDNPYSCNFLVKIYGFYLDTVYIDGNPFSRITLPTSHFIMEKGNPELPRLVVSTIIPDLGNVGCEISAIDFKEFDILPIIPSKGILPRSVNPDEVPYTFNEIYYNGEWFPYSLEVLSSPFYLCDFRGVNVYLNIFRHNPTLHKLVVAKKFEVTVFYEHPYRVKDSIQESFLGIYSHFFLNFSKDKYIDARRVRMTIITADEFYEQAWELRNWKMKKGILVEEVKRISEIGNDTSLIKRYIFTQWNNRGVTYFLLIGDHNHILPPRCRIGSSLPFADPCYVLLFPPNNPDPYPDAFISRISGQNIYEVRNQIKKIIYYERFLPNSIIIPPNWLDTALFMASEEGGDSIRKNNMKEIALRKYARVQKLYNEYANRNNIIQALNSGRGFVNFLGHGDYDGWYFLFPPMRVFNRQDIDDLNNRDFFPFIISVACNVGDFGYNPCFAEKWMIVPSKGSVAFYGSSYFQDWDPPVWADSVAIHSFCYDWFINIHRKDFPNTLGEILYVGGVEMIRVYGDAGSKTFNTWHIFGDASMQIRFGPQKKLIVVHDSFAYPCDTFKVFVWEVCSLRILPPFPPFPRFPPFLLPLILPSRSAVVCLWKEDNSFNVYTLTDSFGRAYFVLPYYLTPGPMYVTVTKYNSTSYEGIAYVINPFAKGSQSEEDTEIQLFNKSFSTLPSVSKSISITLSPLTSIEIYDAKGELIKKVNKKEEVVNLKLSNGIYFLRISLKEKIINKKIVIVK